MSEVMMWAQTPLGDGGASRWELPAVKLPGTTCGGSGRRSAAGAVGVVGEVGAGKSFAVKCLTWATVARGGQVVVVDSTPSSEWVGFASVAPCSAQVIDLADADHSLDPLAVFTGDDRARVAVGLLSLLTDADALELIELSRAVWAVCAHPGGRLVDVVGELEARGVSNTAAGVVGRRLRALSVEDGLAQLFLAERPPLRLDDVDGGFVVFHTPVAARPGQALHTELLASQAALYVGAACARAVALRDPGRDSAVLVDDAWRLTGSPAGAQLVYETLTEGPDRDTATWLVSHNAEDLGDPRIRGLLGNRLFFHRRGRPSRSNREFIDADPDAVALLEQTGRGVGLYRTRDDLNLVAFHAPTVEAADAFAAPWTLPTGTGTP